MLCKEVLRLEKWIKELTIDDLNLDEKNKELCETLGLELYFKFIQQYGGCRLYVNMYDEVLKNARNKKIRQEYNRYNVRQLANKYSLTEERIKQIVSDMGMENQISFFD